MSIVRLGGFDRYIQALIEGDLNKALRLLEDAFQWKSTVQGFHFWSDLTYEKELSIETLIKEALKNFPNSSKGPKMITELRRSIEAHKQKIKEYEDLFV